MRKRYIIHETYNSLPGRIDKEKGIIYNVKIVGKISKNKRRYTDESLERGRELYENLSVFIDHELGVKKRTNTSVHDHGGVIRNVQRKMDGLYGDVHYNRASKAGLLVLECAERFPDRFGFSQHAVIDGYVESGVKIIEKIIEVRSMDLVTNPATVDGIFESVEEKVEAPVVETPGEEVSEAAQILLRLDALEAKIDSLIVVKEEAVKKVVKPLFPAKSAPRQVVKEEAVKPVKPKTKEEIVAAWGLE